MDFATFFKVQEKRKKKREKKKEERLLYLGLSAGNIAGVLFICLCQHVLKPLLYFICPPRVKTYSLCCLPVELPSFCMTFSASFASIYSR